MKQAVLPCCHCALDQATTTIFLVYRAKATYSWYGVQFRVCDLPIVGMRLCRSCGVHLKISNHQLVEAPRMK